MIRDGCGERNVVLDERVQAPRTSVRLIYIRNSIFPSLELAETLASISITPFPRLQKSVASILTIDLHV